MPSPEECQIWEKAFSTTGYGAAWDPATRRMTTAHRAVYEQEVGPIPEGMEIHHECGNRACVNVDHLKLVTRREHTRYGAKTHCLRGHDLADPMNVRIDRRGRRQCRACGRYRDRIRRGSRLAFA